MENGELEIVKKLPKTGDRFQATSCHENNEGHAVKKEKIYINP